MVTGKQPIVINKPVPGFLFNRLQVIGYIVLVASGILVHHIYALRAHCTCQYHTRHGLWIWSAAPACISAG